MSWATGGGRYEHERGYNISDRTINLEDMVHLRRSGWTCVQLSQKFDLSPRLISRILKDLDIASPKKRRRVNVQTRGEQFNGTWVKVKGVMRPLGRAE